MLKLLDPYRWLIGGLLVALLIGGAIWYHASTLEKGREEIRQQLKVEADKQIDAARKTSDNLIEVKDEALENATKRAQVNAAAAARARSELARLRNQAAGAPSVPGDSCATSIDRAAALGELLGACAERYSDVARAADAHASDAVTLHQAWPRIDRASIEAQRAAISANRRTKE